ncbi:hypothetical protein [Streptomyces sp. TLI_171]|uniref:hypothetical protein n=1 Tax=Streptomyces sp. TLI_171 TaxID=1938859 RepID=UPI00117F5677|nr:hypothetical protein [Streptomyces sp. TLI_171]
MTTPAYAAVRPATELQVCASSPSAAPPKEMMTLPPADCSDPIWDLNAPTGSPPLSHIGVQPDFGVRNAGV